MARPTKQGAAAISFLENLIIPEGKRAGTPVKLAKYQKAFINGALKANVMVACLSIGRGNGKTALAAGLALADVMGVLGSGLIANR